MHGSETGCQLFPDIRLGPAAGSCEETSMIAQRAGRQRVGTERAGHIAIVLVAFMLAAGCTLLPELDADSPYFKVPKGSVIELHERIEIPRDYARVWIQDGRVRGTSFNAFEPSCGVEVSRINRESSQFVEPGRFQVVKTQFLREEVVEVQPLRVASSAPVKLTAAEDQSASDSLYHEGYHLWVKSPEQPNVRRFTCRGIYDFPANAKPPSIRDIRAAMGPVATLWLPEDLEAAE